MKQIAHRKWDVLNSMPSSPGIYLIHNKANHHQYVGLSNNIKRRVGEHLTPKHRRKSTVLGRAFTKYPAHCFQYFVIEFVHDIKDLEAREMYWISIMRPEYNMNAGGNGNLGRAVTEETRSKCRAAAKNQWSRYTDEQRREVVLRLRSNRPIQTKVSEATKEKLRAANIGKKQSPETIAKRAAAIRLTAIGNKNGNKAVVAFRDGIMIGEFESLISAGKHFNTDPSGICEALKGKQKTCAGCVWKYKTSLS